MNPLPRLVDVALLGTLIFTPIARAADSIDLKPLANEKTVLVARFVPAKIKTTAVPPWLEQTFKDAGLQDVLSRNILDGAGRAAGMVQHSVDTLYKGSLPQADPVINS